VAGAVALAGALPAAGQPLPLDRFGWTLHGDARVGPYLGREALLLGSGGEAYYAAARLEDGTIEFDVAVSTRRTFVGVHFRAASEEVWEDVYIRPHKSGLNDAIQYLITLDEHTVYLPLDAGDNELVLAVSDVFGGWGFMGQFPERAGLTVRPPAEAR